MKKNDQDSNELLASLNSEEEKAPRGRLKIFFGISPGAGKTYAMFQAAQDEAIKGLRVVVGYVECRNRPDVCALLDKLIVIPRKKNEYKGISFEEPDMDAILNMHPDLVLIPDLAHVNVPESRHMKRYLDIEELLDNGISVYTTLDVLHLESCVDEVFRITDITITETIPDEIFGQADEVEFIDVTEDELLERLAKGKVCIPENSREAIGSFFRKDKISALRKLMYRVMIDRSNKRRKNIEAYPKIKLRILILMGSDSESAQLIRRAKAMAYLMGTDWMALYVETNRVLTEEEKKQLADNIKLVRQQGGEFIAFSGKRLMDACLEVVQRENISHIIVGKSEKEQAPDFMKQNFINRLIKKSDNFNVLAISLEPSKKNKRKEKSSFSILNFEYGKYVAVVLLSIFIAVLCLLLADKTGYRFLPFVVLLVMFVLAVILRASPVLLAIVLAVLAWGIFLIPSRFAFRIDTTSEMVSFLMFFVIALLNGILAIRFREQEKRAVYREKQTNALFLLTKRLGSATDIKDVALISMENIQKYFSVNAFFIFRNGNDQLTNQKYLPEGLILSESELQAAVWAFKYEKNAGKFTDTLSSDKYTYYPLKGPSIRSGVVIVEHNKPFDGNLGIFWDAFLAQIAQSIEHQYLGHLARRTNLLNESDKLYKTLFNSISHELRIPVATIMGASDILLTTSSPDHIKTELYGEVFEASKRLNRLIENLLNMSRLESGRIAVHLNWCDIHDLINRVTESLKEELQPFNLDVVIYEPMSLVKLDFGLMEQVLYNLVFNSCQYTRNGTTIRIKVLYDNGQLIMQITDRGPGFEPDALPFVFDKFWRAKNGIAGGLGLGLSIVKGLVEAHKGTVDVENRKNGGARFTIKIPTEISNEDENE